MVDDGSNEECSRLRLTRFVVGNECITWALTVDIPKLSYTFALRVAVWNVNFGQVKGAKSENDQSGTHEGNAYCPV